MTVAAIAAGALLASPAQARLEPRDADPARTYVLARLAALNGDHARAAQMLATLADSGPDQTELTKRALGEAMGAGQLDLAMTLARSLPPAQLASDARLLLASDDIRHNRLDRAIEWLSVKGDNGDLLFLRPVITAWDAANQGDLTGAQKALAGIPNNGLLTPYRDELQAEILLKFRRVADAEPFARRAIGSAGSREGRIRLAMADGFLGAGDRARAEAMVDGIGTDGTVPRRRILAGKPSGEAIDTLPKSLSEVLTSLAADVARMQRSVPIGLVQVARSLDPFNAGATSLLAVMLDGQERTDEALALLRAVPDSDALSSPIRDLQVQMLTEGKRNDEAYHLAASIAARPDATSADLSRLGNALAALNRHSPAADAYAKAIALAQSEGATSDLWSLYLVQASELEQSNRWPEAKAALQSGLALAPEQPLLLNFLGYAKLERGEDMDSAEAMIRKASALAPDDASIIDSLGWAEFKRGKVTEAIDTLQQAAAKDPEQAEIQEHLGDALYTSGRRYEARYAWSAALITAEDDVAGRIKAKIQAGLSAANAAP